MFKKKYDIFLICPVRNASEDQKHKIMDYVEMMEDVGKKVYYPARDTNQNDRVGFRICSDNKKAMKNSKEVHIFWDKESQGTLFDLGMAFSMGKNLEIVNVGDVVQTDGSKSFSNMIGYWNNKR